MATKTKVCFPPVRLVEDNMTKKQILETFNTAMSGDAVIRVTMRENVATIHFDQECMMHQEMWDMFYADLSQYGAVWIKAEYRGDEYYPNCTPNYHTSPQPGHWEVQYARRKSKRPWPPQQPTVPVPKVCTCGCTCGARVGTTF